ncbi:MAG: HAD family hydrolase [Nitrospirae bacterium]|nr:HAD family hydrolase [Nitrospirota bacterium]
MKRAVFFDRDGVLIEPVFRRGRPSAPLTLEEFVLVAGAKEEVARIRRAGFLALVVTNQPELARGELDPEILHQMHRRLEKELSVDGIYVCPHEPSQGCVCHKPRPGLLHQAARCWDLDCRRSFLIGDRWRDIGAGRSAGCTTVLIERDYSGALGADRHVPDLSAAVDHILRVADLSPPVKAGAGGRPAAGVPFPSRSESTP